MFLDPKINAGVITQIEAALNEAYLAGWERESDEGRLAVENEVFRRYNQATEYAVPWVNRVAPLAGCQVIEIGCGTGSSTAAFARLAGHVHGYDIEPSFVEGARIRAQTLGLSNVSCHVVTSDQLLSDVCHRHGAGQVDLVLLFAVLEHCTGTECLETIQTSWNLLRPGGHLAIIETPNRLGYMDVHTTLMPFFHILPAPIALRYYRRTQRQSIITALDAAARVSEQEAELARIRLGTGISFHEFQIALGIEDLGPVLAADGYEPEMLAWFPITLEERLLQTFFLARNVPAPIGFSRFVLNVILRKPIDTLPTEPLIPLSSRSEFITNYSHMKATTPIQQPFWRRLLRIVRRRIKVAAPMQQTQEFDRLGKAELIISEGDADRLIPANQINIAQGNDHIRLESTGNDPYFYLPPLDAPLQMAVMKIDINAPGYSILQVFYVTNNLHSYTEERSICVPFYCGRNTLLVKLPPGVTGQMRIDLGEMPGEYYLYRIELRQ